jgi:ABC-type multidrug transport system ATPase subunit
MRLAVENLQLPCRANQGSAKIHFEFADNQTIAVVGASHSGKSTLLLVVSGFMEPRAGRVRIVEEDGDNVREYLPQPSLIGLGPIAEFSPLFGTLTVREHIYYQLKLLRQRSARQRTDELMEWLDLTEQAKVRVKDLDAFSHFRVSLAVAAAGRPRFVLLDDPLRGLTEDQCAQAGRWFRDLNAKATGVLFTTLLHSALPDVDGFVQLPEGTVTYVDAADRHPRRVDAVVAQ